MDASMYGSASGSSSSSANSCRLYGTCGWREAVARITWCIAERAIGVITGEVGAGKTASVRTVLAGLDASRHTIIYLPNPMIGVRGYLKSSLSTPHLTRTSAA